MDNNCDVETGQCPCQSNFAGKECNQCAHGYFNYPACTCKSMIYVPQLPCQWANGYYYYPTCSFNSLTMVLLNWQSKKKFHNILMREV